jgi:5-formyltetrahydrofolate cyclo-ligase
MATLSSLRTQKKELRKAVSATLQLLSIPNLEEQCKYDNGVTAPQISWVDGLYNRITYFLAKAIAANVLSLPSFNLSRSVSCYLSMPSGEADTASLVSEVLSRGEDQSLL